MTLARDLRNLRRPLSRTWPPAVVRWEHRREWVSRSTQARPATGRTAARITLDRLAVTAHQDVLLGEVQRAMMTDLHQRLLEDLASKGLLDNPRADPAETPLRTVHSSGYPDQVR